MTNIILVYESLPCTLLYLLLQATDPGVEEFVTVHYSEYKELLSELGIYHIAGNFQGIQVSQIGHLLEFYDLNLADACYDMLIQA